MIFFSFQCMSLHHHGKRWQHDAQWKKVNPQKQHKTKMFSSDRCHPLRHCINHILCNPTWKQNILEAEVPCSCIIYKATLQKLNRDDLRDSTNRSWHSHCNQMVYHVRALTWHVHVVTFHAFYTFVYFALILHTVMFIHHLTIYFSSFK